MTKGSIPRRYARALIKLGQEENKIEVFGEQLKAFANVLTGNPQLFDTLRNPAYPPAQRKAVLLRVIEIMNLEPLVQNFILLVNDRRRIEYLPDIALAYMELADELAGMLRATVTTAVELKPEQQQVIKNTLSLKMGKQVLVTHQKDPDIIGGIIAKVGNLLFDYSLKNQLRKVQQELVSGQ